jgi:hypothetical protein
VVAPSSTRQKIDTTGHLLDVGPSFVPQPDSEFTQDRLVDLVGLFGQHTLSIGIRRSARLSRG